MDEGVHTFILDSAPNNLQHTQAFLMHGERGKSMQGKLLSEKQIFWVFFSQNLLCGHINITSPYRLGEIHSLCYTNKLIWKAFKWMSISILEPFSISCHSFQSRNLYWLETDSSYWTSHQVLRTQLILLECKNLAPTWPYQNLFSAVCSQSGFSSRIKTQGNTTRMRPWLKQDFHVLTWALII